jgi:magnesium chelatase family protein
VTLGRTGPILTAGTEARPNTALSGKSDQQQRSYPPGVGESSTAVRTRVEAARGVQRERLWRYGIHADARMHTRQIRKFCTAYAEGRRLLETVTDHLGLSARTYTRILKVARTIAYLSREEQIRQAHLAETIQYRSLGRRTS